MDLIQKGWFTEQNELWPGISVSLQIKNVLHSEKSKFQDILVVETESHGRALMLDGIIQCTESDEFSYQEMIALLPLAAHGSPRHVLIVGGGDGGVAREVVKFPGVETVTQVEIDERVVDVSKKYLQFMAKGFDNEKLNLIIGDGFVFMKENQNKFDVIITDSSDPVGPAVSLFEESYFSLMKGALRPGGIVCSQAGTAWSNLDIVKSTLRIARVLYPVAQYAVCSVPTYPTGQIGFVIASLDQDAHLEQPKRTFTEDELDSLELKYYSSEVHRAAFVIPRFAQKALDNISDLSNRVQDLNLFLLPDCHQLLSTYTFGDPIVYPELRQGVNYLVADNVTARRTGAHVGAVVP